MNRSDTKMKCGGCGRVQLVKALAPLHQMRGEFVKGPYIACKCGANAWVPTVDDAKVTVDEEGTG